MVKSERSKRDLAEIERLESATKNGLDSSKLHLFTDLPISERTKQGLAGANFVEMTDIQRGSLGYALCGRDVLGAAKTGSGKTLAFLIPILERLYREKWTHLDGLGALVISPTRELALQIFQVLRRIGKQHSFSAGLVIGGKDVKFERDHINRMNILVCTPGRLLQHMDETPNFDCNALRLLVLDEADRILDLGFKKTVNAILENLPAERQTLLFSATQTKSVRDLARLSLQDPEYVAVHEKAESSTPETLQQTYLVCELQEKLDVLYSFIKTHLQSKCLVFLSSCKQVRFAYEAFCKMQPGTIVMCLHGKQKQGMRNVMFEKFCNAKSAILLCTDIAARGLDFPAVDWVVQADAPEDAETYIHRVGRTARYHANGKALLFLLPSEEKGMLELLEKKKVFVKKIKVNPSKTKTIVPQLQGLCAQSPEIKYLGEKALICYLRSIWQQKHKQIFDVSQLPVEEFAQSLGLPGAPRVKFVRKLKAEKNQSRAVGTSASQEKLKEEGEGVDDDADDPSGEESATPEEQSGAKPESSESESEGDGADSGKPRTRLDRMFAKKNQSLLWDHYEKLKDRQEDLDKDTADAENDGDSGFLKLARKDHELDGIPTMAPGFLERPLSVRDKRNMKLKNRVLKNAVHSASKLVFDEEGNPELAWKLETEADFNKEEDSVITRHRKYLDAAMEVMKSEDKVDKQVQKDRLREKRLKKKLKKKHANGETEEAVAVLGNPDESDDGSDAMDAYDDRESGLGDSDNDDNGGDHDAEEPLEIDLNEDFREPAPVSLKKSFKKEAKKADFRPKRKHVEEVEPSTVKKRNVYANIGNEEELALQLLAKSK